MVFHGGFRNHYHMRWESLSMNDMLRYKLPKGVISMSYDLILFPWRDECL